MADSLAQLVLDQGLDLVSAPITAKPGALIGCLNYELTDITGYRRIDGYERYDGYPNGAIYEYFRTDLVATDPLNQILIVPGSIISRIGDTSPRIDIGIVLGGEFPTNLYDVAPTEGIAQFRLEQDYLNLTDGVSHLVLQSGDGLLALAEAPTTLGSTFIVTTPSGTQFEIDAPGALVEGRTLADPETYLQTIRDYSWVLRNEVLPAPGHIAGLHWFDDRLLAAVNTFKVTVEVNDTDPQPAVNVRLRWNGTLYRLVAVETVNLDTINTYRFHLLPIGTSATVDDDLVEVDVADVAGTVWATDVSDQTPTSANSLYAVLGYYNTPASSGVRGFTYLPPAYSFEFDAGSSDALLGPALTFDDTSDPADAYYLVGGDGTALKVRLTSVVRSDGVWASDTAVGNGQFVVLERIAGPRDVPADNDVLHSEYPTTATSAVLTINGDATITTLPGTGTLDATGTRYVWGTYNFYGQSSTLSAFGATGAGRAFWANEHGYGSITAIPSSEIDTPKYVSFHAGKLVLGYERGSVLLSVLGEPYNFNGQDGAIEIATGDDITGLLELPGSTLAVFGKRSIRKITGYTDADTVLGTIAGNSGCFDYTAVLMGQEAVYAGHNGISTLGQTAAYGDFIGKRLSDPISTWLRPKLVRTRPGFEEGGTICAYPVRSKGQYRLVLASGETVVVTLIGDAARVSLINTGMSGETRVPYAWSSEVSRDGLERIHVRWDVPTKEDMAVEMDVGWGFDGYAFRHYFDTAHLFNSTGSQMMGVERIRMYGQGYGVATLDIKSSGIEEDFMQEYHTKIQDISMPRKVDLLYSRMRPVTSIVDQANWGLGIKLRINGTIPEASLLTEPPHICQVLLLHLRTEGAQDA